MKAAAVHQTKFQLYYQQEDPNLDPREMIQEDYMGCAVKVLADVGAGLEFQDENGWTALMHAAANGSPLAVQNLLEARGGYAANPYVQEPGGMFSRGRTAREIAESVLQSNEYPSRMEDYQRTIWLLKNAEDEKWKHKAHMDKISELSTSS